MKNPLIKLTSNESRSEGQPVYVSALLVQGIELGEELWEVIPETAGGTHRSPVWVGSYKSKDRHIKHGARVYFGTTSHSVRETVEECYALFEAALK